MEHWFPFLLVLGVTYLGYLDTLPLLPWSWDSKPIIGAIDMYNKGLNGSSRFKLLSFDSQDKQAATSWSFVIKETLCSKSTKQNADECGFKENGEIRNCTVTFHGSDSKNIDVTCDTSKNMDISLNDNIKDENRNEKDKSNKLNITEPKEPNKMFPFKSIRKAAINIDLNNANMFSCLQCIWDIFNSRTNIV
ncbi:cathelicidin-1-like [Bombina bombina]|uniref:cathelicidin-1-like n=1 Tax=Bombina bombina TaxID=8345 RepID=UPI00235A5457|nr:cathelicidin-1-like [Bombina bombina]